MNNNTRYPRGAEWRQWDFHVHTPASFYWSGQRFAAMSPAEKTASLDSLVKSMNEASPHVFVLMDYWTFDGWLALKRRLQEAGAPVLKKVVFPGIELRLDAPTTYRLNAHVVFSDETSDQDLYNFKAKLLVSVINEPLSDECLIKFARTKLKPDILEKHGFKHEVVQSSDDAALLAGSSIAVLHAESYKAAISAVPDGNAIGFMPWDTNDGLAQADWVNHYPYVISLMAASPIFETRKLDLWEAFVGLKTANNAKWFDNFHAALGNTPRLAVSGSDAHTFAEYGKFPGGKTTWIKADPTFLGLKQAIKEPAERSCIGERPKKLIEVEGNKTYFIDEVAVDKIPGSSLKESWLDGTRLKLSPDLIAVIGNKGSGKSALADVIALVGNCRSTVHFSFLHKKRFKAPPAVLAKHFEGKLTWRDGTVHRRNLAEDAPPESVEMVRYIPQQYFEEVCNAHVSGKSDIFEKELRSVIFDYTSPEIRQNALDFDQLISQQESGYRDQLGEYRKDLARLNQEIASTEAQMHPDRRKALVELRAQKKKQIDEHDKLMPPKVEKPAEKLTEEQQLASDTLDSIAKKLLELDERDRQLATQSAMAAGKASAIQAVRSRLQLFQRQYKQLIDDTDADLKRIGLTIDAVATVSIKTAPLDTAAVTAAEEQSKLVDQQQASKVARENFLEQQPPLKKKLNEPQQLYQKYLNELETWQKRRAEYIGTPAAPETYNGMTARLAQLDQLPADLQKKREARLKLTGEIFEILDSQRAARAALFEPVQKLIQSNSLIRDDYKLQFRADLGGVPDAFASRLFDLVKRTAGEFSGIDDSVGAVRKVFEKYDLNQKGDALKLVAELDEKVQTVAGGKAKIPGIEPILKAGKTAVEVYDLLFGLSFLEPRYTLLFQDTRIEQLSPGQRGALLLIFYLLVDQGRHPIILDQPEENLDNETIVSLLVPVLAEAKKKRQVIMVTHNPNLAVVCDAEQIIYSTFDRKQGANIGYVGGSIEWPQTNRHVVDVLEGTKRAFDNRRDKYQHH
jgi:ABC-type lipoprotein export system ATPase subunit